MNLIPFYFSKFLNIILLYGLLCARIVPESDLIQTSEHTYARVLTLLRACSGFPPLSISRIFI